MTDDSTPSSGPTAAMPLEDWHRWWKYFGQQPLRHTVLLYWDPIGVYGTPEAMDEYDSYVGQIGVMLGHGTTADEIEGYLRRKAADGMGLGAPSSADAAQRIVSWFEDSMRSYMGQVEFAAMAAKGDGEKSRYDANRTDGFNDSGSVFPSSTGEEPLAPPDG